MTQKFWFIKKFNLFFSLLKFFLYYILLVRNTWIFQFKRLVKFWNDSAHKFQPEMKIFITGNNFGVSPIRGEYLWGVKRNVFLHIIIVSVWKRGRVIANGGQILHTVGILRYMRSPKQRKALKFVNCWEFSVSLDFETFKRLQPVFL